MVPSSREAQQKLLSRLATMLCTQKMTQGMVTQSWRSGRALDARQTQIESRCSADAPMQTARARLTATAVSCKLDSRQACQLW